jgi:hypothetical protein
LQESEDDFCLVLAAGSWINSYETFVRHVLAVVATGLQLAMGIALAVAALTCLVVAIKVGRTFFGQSFAGMAYNYVAWLLAVTTVITGCWAHGPSYLK